MKIAPGTSFRFRAGFLSLSALCLLFMICASLRAHSRQAAAPQAPAAPPTPIDLTVPAGFKSSVFAAGVTSARMMAIAPDGVLIVARNIPKEGFVVALPDRDKDGRADSMEILASKLDRPHSVAFNKDWLYVATLPGVLRARYANGKVAGNWEKIVDIPVNTTGHFTRTIGFGRDGKLYVSIGSTCNVCEETNEIYTTIMRYNADGSGGQAYARGFRNIIGFDWDPISGALWADDMGQDGLGEEFPPDEVNRVEEGKHYGFPYFVGNNVVNAGLKDAKGSLKPEKATPPQLALQAHLSPMGMAFYKSKAFPAPWRNSLFMAIHGSSPRNRAEKIGYKIVRVVLKNGQAAGMEDFISGWLKDGQILGRPAGMITGPDGSFFVSDDNKGFIYRITYEKK